MYYFHLSHNVKGDSQIKLVMVIQSIDSQKVHITILRVLYIFQSIKVRLKNLNIVRLIICRFGLKIILKSFGAADQYTSETRRTSSHITIALPKRTG